jgi:hypothetical protein
MIGISANVQRVPRDVGDPQQINELPQNLDLMSLAVSPGRFRRRLS